VHNDGNQQLIVLDVTVTGFQKASVMGYKRKPAEFVQCRLEACTGAAFNGIHLFFVTVPDRPLSAYLRLKSCTKTMAELILYGNIADLVFRQLIFWRT
jgi:hypothetical protein